MVKIYEMQREQWGIFFNRGKQLILQYKEGERTGRSILLANDYESGFGGILYEGTLYYVYVNDRGECLLRSVRDNLIYYQIRDRSGEGRPLRLSIRQGQLVFWYVDREEQEEKCSLQCIYPFRPQLGRRVIEGIPVESVVQLLETGEEVLVMAGQNGEREFFVVDADFRVHKLGTDEEFGAIARREMQTQVEQMQSELEQLRETLREEMRNEAAEKEKEWEKQLNAKDAQLKHFQGMIESATHQYEELMHVAEQYRDEAVKWRNKFTFF